MYYVTCSWHTSRNSKFVLDCDKLVYGRGQLTKSWLLIWPRKRLKEETLEPDVCLGFLLFVQHRAQTDRDKHHLIGGFVVFVHVVYSNFFPNLVRMIWNLTPMVFKPPTSHPPRFIGVHVGKLKAVVAHHAQLRITHNAVISSCERSSVWPLGFQFKPKRFLPEKPQKDLWTWETDDFRTNIRFNLHVGHLKVPHFDRRVLWRPSCRAFGLQMFQNLRDEHLQATLVSWAS